MFCSVRALAFNSMLLLILFAGINLPLFAGGSKEDAISTARQYIIEKKYDPALALLADLIKTDATRFDEAYALVQQIQLIKGDYNSYLQDLFDVLTKDPGNYEKALAAINKMSALDPNPSERNRQKIEDFRIVAKITKDRSDKDKLMARALAQIQQKEYLAAIDIYLTGFDLQAADFLIGTQSADFKSAVLNLVKQVRANLDVYKTENAKLMPSLEKFSQDIAQGSEGLDRVAAALPLFSGQLLQTINQTVQLEQSGAQSTALRQRSDKEYPSSDKRNFNYNEYVRFIQEFMQGPPGKTGQGIAYAARTLIDSEYADTLARLEGLYNDRKQQLASLLQQPNPPDPSQAFTAIGLTGNLLMRANGLKGNVDLGNKPSFADLTGKLPVTYRKVPAAVLFELHAYEELQFNLTQKAVLDTLTVRTAATVWQDALVALDAVKKHYAAWLAETQAVQDAALIDRVALEKGRAIFVPTLNLVQDGLLNLPRVRFSAIVSGQLEAVRTPFGAALIEEKHNSDLLNGPAIASARDAAASQVIYRYPDQALTGFTALRLKYQDYLKSLDNLDATIRTSRPEVREYAPVVVSAAASTALRKEILDALAQLDVAIARAQANIKTGQERQQRAAIAANEADAAVSNNRLDVDAADKSFADASDLYFKAFDIAYNKDQRTAVDVRMQALRSKIDDARNRLLVLKKRQAIELAKTNLEHDQNTRAFDSITQAEKLDSQTVEFKLNLEQGKTANEAYDPEIPYWKSRIQAASSLSNERIIAESDPSFFSLSNFLNLAQIDYSKAIKLDKDGQKDTAKPFLDHAISNIDNVLLVKPNNKDAKFLRLQVERIRDPVLFDQLFPNRVNDAIAAAKRDPNNKSLTDMYALKQIKPGNADLEQAIFDLEVKLGLRDSPLTKARKAEAAGLVAQARPLVSASRQVDIRRGLDLINQAIRLDPTNREAGNLADAARGRLRAIPDSLSFEEQQSFNRANELLAGGNTSEPFRIVTDLIAKHPGLDYLKKFLAKVNLQLGN